MTVIVAPIFGPILGGYSDNYHWGWIFFINIPIGVFVIVAAMATLKGEKPKPRSNRSTPSALVLLIVGIGSLQIMLDQGGAAGSTRPRSSRSPSSRWWRCCSGGVGLTDDHPVVDLSLFKSRNFTIGCLCISLAYMLYFGAIVLLPQLLQEGVRLYRHTGGAGVGAGWASRCCCRRSSAVRQPARHARLVTFSFIMYAVLALLLACLYV